MPVQRVLRTSARRLDVSISGPAYFPIYNSDDCRTYLTRLGAFELGPNGDLMTRVDGRLWPLEPPVCIAQSATDVEILPDGQVRALIEGKWSRQGSIQLAYFADDPHFWNQLSANRFDGRYELNSPGTKGVYLISGWIEVDRRYSWQTICAGAVIGTFALSLLIKRLHGGATAG